MLLGVADVDVEEVLKLLEQRRNEYQDRADFKVVAIKPEERITAQIETGIARELDALIDEIRAKLSSHVPGR